MSWSLEQLLANLHADIQHKLQVARTTMGHTVAKGCSTESVWLELLQSYLPLRYQAAAAFVVDHKGDFSHQLDVVVFDRQYSPFIFSYQGQTIIPAESVYAVFEAKQTINAEQVSYAQAKLKSVRRLARTSLPIPHAGGTYPPKALSPILGGLLTLESDWNPPLGESLNDALKKGSGDEQLDIGCVAAHGVFERAESGEFVSRLGGKPATAFLFELIARLQVKATVPMIDVRAYAKWLTQ